jgi:hypothetical protein
MSEDLERRKFTRFDVDPIICRTEPESKGLCILRNVSVSGAYFLSTKPPPVGTFMKVQFSEMPLDGYQVNGKVVRHGNSLKKGFALTFRGPHPKLLRAVYHTDYE